ncbi:hypothetical protein NPIL_428921 [Nephila pilipes]|uniref:Uncharacterized protein n=1 Tax=Nephila pilipes TaxID=299642 RepID=A0A8X6NHJ7_NEPPI|nr:hypothetical protein NPIL_428921 [Nephila pilipes]
MHITRTIFSWHFLHDNAPTCSSDLVQSFMSKRNIPGLRHVPSFPDKIPRIFWLFSKLKMCSTTVQSREDIMQDATDQLCIISKEKKTSAIFNIRRIIGRSMWLV